MRQHHQHRCSFAQAPCSAGTSSLPLTLELISLLRSGTRVTADTPKGHVRVYKVAYEITAHLPNRVTWLQDENQLTHFTWKQRTKQVAEMVRKWLSTWG